MNNNKFYKTINLQKKNEIKRHIKQSSKIDKKCFNRQDFKNIVRIRI